MGINKKDRDRFLRKSVKDQGGEYCKGCGGRPHPSIAEFLPEYLSVDTKLEPFFIKSKDGKRYLGIILDHIDNDENHNNPDNHQPLCQSCNLIKNPRGKLKGKTTLYPREATPEMQRGDEQEDRYRSWLNRECTVEHKADFITDQQAIYSGAEYLTDFSEGKTISPSTTIKYLKKLTSDSGNYFWYKGFVGLKVNMIKLEEWFEDVERRKQRKVKKLKEFQEAYVRDFNEKQE